MEETNPNQIQSIRLSSVILSHRYVGTLIIVFGLLGGYFITAKLLHLRPFNQVDTQSSSVTNQQQIDASNWRTYLDEEFGFEMKFPLYFSHIPVSSGDLIVESYGEFSAQSNRSDRLYLAVHNQPLDGFEYFNQVGGYGFRYSAKDQKWKKIVMDTPDNFAPKKYTINTTGLVYYFVQTGDAATAEERIFVESPTHNLFVELSLSRNNSYLDCVTPCPEQKPFSDTGTIHEILSMFQFL